jgi:hypothetical protein
MVLHGEKQGYAASVISSCHPTKNVNISNSQIVTLLLIVHLFPHMINPLNDRNVCKNEHYP